MTQEIDRAGIPVVQICNLIDVAKGVGVNRYVQGKSVLYACGDPQLPSVAEDSFRKRLIQEALHTLEA